MVFLIKFNLYNLHAKHTGDAVTHVVVIVVISVLKVQSGIRGHKGDIIKTMIKRKLNFVF